MIKCLLIIMLLVVNTCTAQYKITLKSPKGVLKYCIKIDTNVIVSDADGVVTIESVLFSRCRQKIISIEFMNKDNNYLYEPSLTIIKQVDKNSTNVIGLNYFLTLQQLIDYSKQYGILYFTRKYNAYQEMPDPWMKG